MKKSNFLPGKKLFILFAGILLCSTTTAQDKQERTLPEFSQIEVSGNLTVALLQAKEQRVVVMGGTDIQEAVITEVKDGILKISQKKGTIKDARIEIAVVELSQIKQSGATKVKGSGKIISPSLSIETSGASSISFDIEAINLTTNITGAGDVKLSGTATNHTAKISGAGSLKATNLLVENSDLNISGAGDARINTSNSLTAKVNGAGSIKYVEEPQTKNVEIHGAGSVSEVGSVGKAAMDVETGGDTTRIRIGNAKVLVIPGEERTKKDTLSQVDGKKKFSRKNRWAGIDVGVAGYISPEPSFGMRAENSAFELNYARSRFWNINFLEKNFKLINHNVGLVTGLGMNFARYHFNDRQNILNSSPDTTFMTPSTIFSRKHFLSTTHLTVPLMLEFNTHRNPKKSFFLAAGVIGGYRIGSRNVQVTEEDGRRSRSVVRGDFNLNPFRLDATVRLGYGNINLFATYGLNNLFQANRGPELIPVSVGVSLVNF
ncbi:MAG: DUF2807 domain-containing protein [Bacteroidetes bacterium]|nr:DUF2807 domain-containing protein [Bacteroidota bacterium]